MTPAEALLAAENPFADPVARLEAAVPPPPDVASVHAGIRGELRKAIDSVGAGRAQMVMVKGDPGMGKTHELLCLQREAHRAQRGFHFVDIPPLKDVNGPFRHVLRHFIQGLTAQEQLERLLWETLRRVALALREAAWEDGDTELTARLDDVLVGGAIYVGAFRSLIQGDRALGDELYRRGRGLLPLSSLSAELGRVLCRLPDRALQPLIGEWLRGAELPDEDLAALGLKASLDSEARCFEVFQGLVKLSPNPVALGFDQLESTSGLLGTAGAAALFHALMEMFQQVPVCIVLMCQTQHWAELRPHLPQAAVERVRDLGTLQKPTAEEAARLVGGRMAPLWKVAGVSPPYPTYPFSRRYLDAHVAQTRPTIRGLFLDLGDRLEEMRRAGSVAEPGGAPAAAPPRRVDARQVLAREHERRSAEVAGRPDSREPSQRQERLRSILGQMLVAAAARGARIGGAKVLEVSDPPQPARGARPSLVAIFEGRDGAKRVAFEVYGDKPQTVHFPLRRLTKKLEDGEVDAGFLLREQGAPLEAVGKASKEMLWWLTPRGGVVWLEERVVWRLVGADLLLDAVSASEVGGAEPVTRDAALIYLLEADDLGTALRPWLSQVIPPDGEDLVDRLSGLVATKSVLPIARAAELLKAPVPMVEQAVQSLVEQRRVMVQTGKDGRVLLVRLGGGS